MSMRARMRRAIVVGCSAYPETSGRASLPSVERTIDDLCSTLIGYCDFDHRGVAKLHNPTRAEIGDTLGRVTQEKSSQLLFYYAGHGLTDRDGQLYLTDPSTVSGDNAEYSAYSYGHIRNALQGALAAGRTDSLVVVLDCCFAGRAGAFDTASNARRRVDGGAMLLACAPTAKAFAPDGAQYTTFTGELLTLILEGDETLSAPVTWGQIYAALQRRVTPTPMAYFTDGGAELTLTAKNRFARPIRGTGRFHGVPTPVLGTAVAAATALTLPDVLEAIHDMIDDHLT
jgi:hypothetical protein